MSKLDRGLDGTMAEAIGQKHADRQDKERKDYKSKEQGRCGY